MQREVTDQITVDAPVNKVWRVLAHDFDKVSLWSSGIAESIATTDRPILEGATISGRVCLSDGFGGDVQEEFTYYDEVGMRLGYKAIGDLPWFFNGAENNWHVCSLEPNKSVVEFRAEVDMKFAAALFMAPLMPVIKKIWGTRTLEEFKYYVEHGQPHPRKLKARQKQMTTA